MIHNMHLAYATTGAVNAVLIMLDYSKEGVCNVMAASCSAADRRCVTSACTFYHFVILQFVTSDILTLKIWKT